MQKHAYMIIAHNEFDLLETLVRLLDDPRNDLYIHIDAKVQDFDFDRFRGLVRYSGLYFTPQRVSVTSAAVCFDTRPASECRSGKSDYR